jgi:lysophospholipase L1-like esterase
MMVAQSRRWQHMAAWLLACGIFLVGAARSSGGTAPTSGPPVYVAIGASDAFGIGTDDPRRDAWPRVLANHLTPAPHLINLGIPGATTSLALRDELPIALAAHPTLVTVWLAVNDFDDNTPLATYTQQLRILLAALAQTTTATVYVANLPDLTLLPHFAASDPTALRARMVAWNTAIAAACQENGAHLIDLTVAWASLAQHPEYLSSDGFHPSTLGAAKLANIFAQALASSH